MLERYHSRYQFCHQVKLCYKYKHSLEQRTGYRVLTMAKTLSLTSLSIRELIETGTGTQLTGNLAVQERSCLQTKAHNSKTEIIIERIVQEVDKWCKFC
jgi:hypothetical protein